MAGPGRPPPDRTARRACDQVRWRLRRRRDPGHRAVPMNLGSDGSRTGMSFDAVWEVPDHDVATGRTPGYAGAVRIGDDVDTRAGGRLSIEPDAAPVHI